jgi:hypothetical protein
MTNPFYGTFRPFGDGRVAKADELSPEERAAAERAATAEMVVCAGMVRRGEAADVAEARLIRRARSK